MPSEVLEFFRETEPRFKEVSDDELTEFIAETKPEFLQDKQFSKRVGLVTERRKPVTALSREDEEGPPIPIGLEKGFSPPKRGTVPIPGEPQAIQPPDVNEGQFVDIDISDARRKPFESTTQGGAPIDLPTPRVAFNALADQLRLPTTEPRVSIPSPQPVEGESAFLTVGKEAMNIAKGIPEFLTSEVGLASIPAAALAPVVVAGAFTVDMLHSLGQQIAEVVPNWSKLSKTQKAVAVTDIVGTGLMAGMIASHGITKATGIRAPLTRGLETQKAKLSKDLAFKLGQAEPAVIPSGPLPLTRMAVRAMEGKVEAPKSALPPEAKVVVADIPPVRAEDFIEPNKPREGQVIEADEGPTQKVVGAEEFVEPDKVELPAKAPVEPPVAKQSLPTETPGEVKAEVKPVTPAEAAQQIKTEVQPIKIPKSATEKEAARLTKERTADAKRKKEELIARLEKELETALPAEAMGYNTPRIKIEIPGDGDFDIVASKENLQDLLRRAKRISTDPGGKEARLPRGAMTASENSLAKQLERQAEQKAELDRKQEAERKAKIPPEPLADEANEKHLQAWLEDHYAAEDIPEIGAEIRNFVRSNPDVVERNSWTQIQEMAHREQVDIKAKQQTDLPNSTTKFKEGDKVWVGQEPMHREGEVTASGPFKNGEQHYFVKTNLGEVLYSERDIRPKKQADLPMDEPDIEARKATRDLFDIPDEDLGRMFGEREPSVENLGRSKYPFANYQEFKDWMNARYGERDLDGMKEAFAEVGAPFKVQYVKEHRTADAHLQDWIRHMATGSPLPSFDPPKPRTTPRPMPGAWQAPPPGATGKTPPTGGPSAGATPPGATPPQPPPPRPSPPSAMPGAPVGTAPAQAVRASEIIKSMAEAMDRPIRIGHIKGGKDILGIFKSKLEVARLRRANDIPTAAHEFAHGLERLHRRALGKGSDIGRAAWEKQLPADVRTEFKGMDYDPTKQRTYEGFAEFVRHWLTEFDTQKVAPKAHAWFENVFLNHNPELKTAMGSIRERAKQFHDQGSLKRFESMIRFEGEQAKLPLAERIKKFGSRILTLWSDDIRPLEKIEKEMNSGQLGMGTQSPSKIARVVTQASGTRARSWALYGMTNFAGNRIGPSLKEIFGKAGVKGDERRAIVYAMAKRVLELAKPVQGAKGARGRGIDSGVSTADARYVVDQLKNPERDAFAKEIRQWNEGAMKYLLDAGGISKETFDNVSSMNQQYIPFYRVFEEEVPRGFTSAGRRLADTPQPIKGIGGSGREFKDPTDSMLNHANQIVSTADKIRVARSLVELSEAKAGLGKYVEWIPADKVPIQFNIGRIAKDLKDAGADLSAADLDAVLTLFQNSPRTPTGGNIVSFVRNGERMFFELHPDLYRVVQALDHHQIHPLLNAILGIPSRAVRLGATGLRAGFSLFTNPVRDYASLLLQSRFNPAEASVKWVQHLGKQLGFKDSEIKDMWRTTGGELSQPLGMDRRSLQKEIGAVMANTPSRVAWHIVKHPVEFAREALSFTEAAPRLAEFEMTLREMGWKPGQSVTADMAIEAARNAAEVTIDFRRAGAWGRSVNQAVAFFNPSVQGLSKFNRAHISNTKRSLASGLGFITSAALANWWLNKDDQDWQKLPNWVKYGFLNFKIGGEWIRFPTPFEWWYAYGAVPMASLNALHEKKPKEVTAALGQAFRTLTPPIIPSVATPLIEAAQNKSFFTGKPIVSRAQSELVPQEQAKPYTSTTARKVSEILGVGGVDVSPAKIEHVLNGETGGFWSDLIGVSERVAGVAPPKESREPADIPIAGRLFVRDTASAIVDEFYTEIQHLSAKKATYQKLTAEGSARAAKYSLSDTEAGLLGRLTRRIIPGVKSAQEQMSDLRKALNQATTRAERKAVFQRMEELASSVLSIPKEQTTKP